MFSDARASTRGNRRATRRLVGALACALVGAAATSARADGEAVTGAGSEAESAVGLPTPAAPSSRPGPTTRLTSWYGYQILLSDAAFVGLGFATDKPEVWFPGYLGAPILIHALHGRVDLAVLSPAARLILPLVGMAIGSQHKHCNAGGDECELGGAIVGAGTGALVAMLLDWGLAWNREVVPTSETVPPAAPAKPAGPSVSGGFAPRRDGLSLVLGGTF